MQGEKAGDTVTEKKAHHADLRRFHIGILQMGVQVKLSASAQSILAVENRQSQPASTASSLHSASKCGVLLRYLWWICSSTDCRREKEK